MRIFLSGNEEVCKWHLPVAKGRALAFAALCKTRKLFQNVTSFTFVDTKTEVSIQYINGEITVRLYSPIHVFNVVRKEKRKEENKFNFLISVGTEEAGYYVLIVDNFGNTISVEFILTYAEINTKYQREVCTEIYSAKYSITYLDDALGTLGPLTEHFEKPDVPSGSVDFIDGCVITPTAKCPIEVADDLESCVADYTDSVVVTAGPSDNTNEDAVITQEYFARAAIRLWCADRDEVNYQSLFGHKHDWIQTLKNSVGWLTFGTNAQVTNGTIITYGPTSIFLFYKLLSNLYQCTSMWGDSSTLHENMLLAYGLITFQSLPTPVGYAKFLQSTITDSMVKEFLTDQDMAYGRDDLFTYIPVDNEVINDILNVETRSKYYSFSIPTRATVSGSTAYLSPMVCPLTKGIVTGGVPGFMSKRSNVASHDIALAVNSSLGKVHLYFKSFLEAEFVYDTSASRYDRNNLRQAFAGIGNFVGNPDEVIRAIANFFKYVRYRNLGISQLSNDMPTDIGTILAMTSDELAVFTDSVFGAVECYIVGNEQTTNDDDATAVFELVNAERALELIAPLTIDFDLQYAAKIHAEDMAQNNFIGHYGTDNASPFDRVSATNFGYRIKTDYTVGENCQYASGDISPEAAIVEWMSSIEGHREAILNPDFKYTGIATAFSSTGVVYRCQVFGQLN